MYVLHIEWRKNKGFAKNYKIKPIQLMVIKTVKLNQQLIALQSDSYIRC